MKNKAKCKLCQSIIESMNETHYVTCSCGEISVDGGESMRCAARNFDNFLRIDDEGNEVVVQVKEKYCKSDLINMLESFIEKIEQMPPNALYSSVNHYDLLTSLNLIHMILKAKD